MTNRLLTSPWLLAAPQSPLRGARYWFEYQSTSSLVGWFLVWLLLVAVVIWIYRHDRTTSSLWKKVLLVGLRAIFLAGVLLAAMGWVRKGARTDLPDLVFLIDVSQSMSHQELDTGQDEEDQEAVEAPSRLDKVLDQFSSLNAKKLSRLTDQYNFKIYSFGETTQPIGFDEPFGSQPLELAATDDETRLGDAVQEILELQQGRPTAAIVLLTDGVSTEGTDLADVSPRARRRGIPLSIVGVGSESPAKDFRIGDVRFEETVFVNDLVTFDFDLVATGLKGERATVRLQLAGEETILDEWSEEVPSDEVNLTGRLNHRPDAEGEYEYLITVGPIRREANKDNNRSHHLVTVRDETVRVLLVSDQPSFEYRFLKQLLARLSSSGDGGNRPAFDLTSILQDAQLRYAETDEQARTLFPIRREELFSYDVLILCDPRPAGQRGRGGGLGPLELENIEQFVIERGGGVVLIHGPLHLPQSFVGTALESLLPYQVSDVELPQLASPLTQPFQLVPTTTGESFPGFWLAESSQQSKEMIEQLPDFYWLPMVSQLKPTAVLLAEAVERHRNLQDGLPLITRQQIGAGQVLTHLFDETYRWRTLVGDLYFERYWVQSIRFLSRQKLLGTDKQVELTTDREEYRAGEAVKITARFLDLDAIPDSTTLGVELTSLENEPSTVRLSQEVATPERYSFSVADLEPGSYRVLYQVNAEKRPVVTTFEIQQSLAEMTDLQMAGDTLRRAAKVSRGRFYTLDDADQLWDELPHGEPVNVAPLPPLELWQQPLLAATWILAIVTLLVTEWLLRKNWGMI